MYKVMLINISKRISLEIHRKNLGFNVTRSSNHLYMIKIGFFLFFIHDK